MDCNQAIKILRNEYECAKRDDCDRSCCANCDLVMDKADVLAALNLAIDCVQNCAPRWISVEDALPVPPEFSHIGVLAYNGNEVMYLLYEQENAYGKIVYRWIWKYPWKMIYYGPEITHWMPMPEPPSEWKE